MSQRAVRVRLLMGVTMRSIFISLLVLFGFIEPLQSQELTVATVTRPPFSMVEGGVDAGFSLDLWNAVAKDLDRAFVVVRVKSFSEMLEMVRSGAADVAVANISITADREAMMDFSQPIFESGLQIMMPSGNSSGSSILGLLFSRNLAAMLAVSIALLFGAGMLMWKLERKAQPYFDKPAREAVFPAFWWALNLVVNGGFEERQPKTWAGRIFGVILVISSLFIVSIFVAKVTATLTIEAIQSNVSSFNDLHGKNVGTIQDSTASRFIESRDMKYQRYADLDTLLQSFESGNLDAIIFDAPILAFYANRPNSRAEMVGSMFRRENYGFALPTGSSLVEPINQSLLRIREDGSYEQIYRDWFGSASNL